MGRGIDRSRLQIKGYGAVNFIADNDTETGQDKNRRIEVRYLSGDLNKHDPPPPPPPAPVEEEKAPTGEEASVETSAGDAAAEAPAEAGMEGEGGEQTEKDSGGEESEGGDEAGDDSGGEESDPATESPDAEESTGDEEDESGFRAAAHHP